MKGWIKLHREAINNPVVMKDITHWGVWTYMLVLASMEEKQVRFKGEMVTLKPGQFVTTNARIATDLNITRLVAFRTIKDFIDAGQIETKGNSHNTLFTIKNWDKYQVGENALKHRRNTDDTPIETPNETPIETPIETPTKPDNADEMGVSVKNKSYFETPNETPIETPIETHFETLLKHRRNTEQEVRNKNIYNNTPRARTRGSDAVIDFCKAYPKDCNPSQVERAYGEAILHDAHLTDEILLTAASNYAEACKIQNTPERFIKSPSRFISDGAFIDYVDGNYKKPTPQANTSGKVNRFCQFEQRETSKQELNELEEFLLSQ